MAKFMKNLAEKYIFESLVNITRHMGVVFWIIIVRWLWIPRALVAFRQHLFFSPKFLVDFFLRECRSAFGTQGLLFCFFFFSTPSKTTTRISTNTGKRWSEIDKRAMLWWHVVESGSSVLNSCEFQQCWQLNTFGLSWNQRQFAITLWRKETSDFFSAKESLDHILYVSQISQFWKKFTCKPVP